MRLSDLTTTSVFVKPPKKKDGYMICKISCNDDKLEVHLKGSLLTLTKAVHDTYYLKCRVDKEQRNALLELEEYAVAFTQANTYDWFKNKIEKDTVEEYFQSSVVYDKKHGACIKAHVDGLKPDALDNLVGKEVDIVLRINGLKFLKQSAYLVFETASCTLSESSNIAWMSEEEDDGCDSESIEIDTEDLHNIHTALKAGYKQKIESYEQHVSDYMHRLQKLQSRLEILEGDRLSLNDLDALYDDLSGENFLN